MTAHSPARRASGFTLLEIIVVVAIITILVALSFAVGALVVRGGQERATQGVLGSLDRALDEYMASSGGVAPPYQPELYREVPGDLDILTTYQGLDQPRRPDATVFISTVSGTGEAGEIINAIPEQFRFIRSAVSTGIGGSASDTIDAPSILDAWSDGDWRRPFNAKDASIILYVHPENGLAQDLFGECKNDRPYFLSAGADTLYGLNDDPFIPTALDGSDNPAGRHTYQTVLAAQEDNLTSYPVDTLSERAFDRTDTEGVR
ncbi:MAG: prepilin-type N-terminal cleavage/methylation domain-containing protein [Planctomycetota bacterium]